MAIAHGARPRRAARAHDWRPAPRRSLAFLAGTALLLAAPAADAGARAAPRRARAVDVPTLELVAMDYAFRVPPRAAPGPTRLVLRNTGRKLHHVQLLRLAPGRRLADLYAELLRRRSIADPPAWAVPAGGPSAALPGTAIAVRQVLAPGRYAVVCWVPAEDGQPHFLKGMVGELEVAADAGARPAARGVDARLDGPVDVRATVREYDVTLSAPLRAGRRVIEVRNAGTQPHELLLVRLAPNATVEAVARWSEQGQRTWPGPAAAWSGVAALPPGGRAWLEVDLAPGRHALFCLAPDAGDGRPHLAHRLHRVVEVR